MIAEESRPVSDVEQSSAGTEGETNNSQTLNEMQTLCQQIKSAASGPIWGGAPVNTAHAGDAGAAESNGEHAMPADDSGHIFETAEPISEGHFRQLFAARVAAKHRAEIRPFSEVSHPALQAALHAAEAAAEVMLPIQAAHSVAEEFGDGNLIELDRAWQSARATFREALSDILLADAPDAATAVQKVEAFFAGQGCAIAADGALEGPCLGHEPKVEAFSALWRDMQRLAAVPATRSQAAPSPGSADRAAFDAAVAAEALAWNTWNVAMDVMNSQGSNPTPEAEEAEGDGCIAQCEAVGRLFDTPAPDLAGALLKLRLYERDFISMSYSGGSSYDGQLRDSVAFRRLREDLERHLPRSSPEAGASLAGAPPHLSAAELARRYHAAVAAFCNNYAADAEETEDAEYEALEGFFRAACDAPIHTPADAAAKVRLGLISFEAGDRGDGRDVATLEQVARWLEGAR
jgi:hypothetical protein